MGVRHNDEPEGPTARVEALVATVRDMSSYLLAVSHELEREVGEALLDHQRRCGAAAPEIEALRAENAQLHEALEGRALIEQAKGMLMAIHRCDEDAAFQLLVTASRQERRKLRLVASEVVDRCTEAEPPAGQGGPAAPSRTAAPRAPDRDQRHRVAQG